MTQWTNEAPTDKLDFSSLFKEDYAILLLRGKNSFGDLIYSYVKVALAGMKRLYENMSKGLPFTPSDFGEVVAAGRGEPTSEVRAEVAMQYPIIDQNTSSPLEFQSAAPAATAEPMVKKAWDEY
jgi:hypothetical protein